MRSRSISVLGAGLVLVTAAACSSSGSSGTKSSDATTSSSAPTSAPTSAPGSSVAVPAGASSAAAYPSATSTAAPGVLRGGSTGDPKIDVLVNVEYRDKKVDPAAGTVPVKAGQRVKVHVSTDVHQDILVAGYPDKTSDVDPGDPEGVDFVVQKKGSVAVSLKQADARLVTFEVK